MQQWHPKKTLNSGKEWKWKCMNTEMDSTKHKDIVRKSTAIRAKSSFDMLRSLKPSLKATRDNL